MKANDLREKSLVELEQELNALSEEQFKLTLHRATGQLTKPHLVKNVRRNIARVKTVIHQKKQESAGKAS